MAKAKRVHEKNIAKAAKGATKRAGKTGTIKKPEISSDVADEVAAAERLEPAQAILGERDARLPPVGTTLVKRDRHGAPRCECTLVADGYRYKNTTYRSLTAAARVAAKDLGISQDVNGLVFWNVVRPKTGRVKPAERLRNAAVRYQAVVDAASKGAGDAEREEIRHALQTHVAQVGKLIAELAA